MRRIRTFDRRHNQDRWLVSYADFITLLFAFFVVMYSAAQLDKRRAGKLATAIQTAFDQLPPKPTDVGGLSAEGVPLNLPIGNTEPNDFRVLRAKIEEALAGEITSGEVAVRSKDGNLIISLREIGFFDTGSDEIKASSAGAFARLAAILRPSESDIRVEGHTDNVPIHNARFSSNWDLSTARATSTIRLLIRQYGFSPERLAAPDTPSFTRSQTTVLRRGGL
jgi:chemotaxis protein MotB